MNILLVLVVLLIIALCFGGFGPGRNWGGYGWSPAGVVLLVLFVLWLTGNLHLPAVPR